MGLSRVSRPCLLLPYPDWLIKMQTAFSRRDPTTIINLPVKLFFMCILVPGMRKQYICKQLPHPKIFTEILLLKMTSALVANYVNRSFFSNSLKALGQTLAIVFLKIIICKKQSKCKGMIESQYCVTILGVFYNNFAAKLTPFCSIGKC